MGFSMMHCFLVDKPWDCHPSDALQDILWEKKVPGLPDFRFYSTFWLTELDVQAHGINMLWRLITENSEIKCVQQKPLFPADAKINPILCKLPPPTLDWMESLLSTVEISLSLIRENIW